MQQDTYFCLANKDGIVYQTKRDEKEQIVSYAVEYRIGLNESKDKYYFHDVDCFLDYLKDSYTGDGLVCEIQVPTDVHIDTYKYTKYFKTYSTHVCVVLARYTIPDFLEKFNLENDFISMTESLKFIKNQTDELCVRMVKKRFNNLEYINNDVMKQNVKNIIFEHYNIKLGVQHKNKKFYKLINKNMINRDFEFVDGLNVHEFFDPNNKKIGLYMCEIHNLKYWLHLYPEGKIYEVVVPDDAYVIGQRGVYRTNKMIITNPLSIIDFIKTYKLERSVEQLYIKIIETDPSKLQHMEYQTLRICLTAVKLNPQMLEFVNLEFLDDCMKRL